MKKHIELLVIGAVVSIMGLSLNSCKQNEQSGQNVTIGMVTFPGYAPLYVAQEKGFFGEVNVELRRIESIGDMRAAIRSGRIDIYAATYDIFQSIEDTDPPGIGFLAIDESHGGDGIVVAKEINSVEDFKGKKVGAEPGFPPYFILQYVLHENSMNFDDISFKDMASQDVGNAFVADRLDVGGTYEPYLSISANKREGSQILYSSEDLPGLIVDWLFADEEFLRKNPESLEAVAKGWFKAVNFIETNQDEAFEIMAKAFNIDKSEMIDIKTGITWLNLKDNQELLDQSKPNNAFQTFERVGDVLESFGETNYRVHSSDKLTGDIIKRLE